MLHSAKCTALVQKYGSYIVVALISAALSGLFLFFVLTPRLENELVVLYPNGEGYSGRNLSSSSAVLKDSDKQHVLGVININTASVDQLCSLYNIGPKRAAAIIAYRTEHPFVNTREIMNISGIGSKTFERIKDEITVGD